MNGVQVRGGRWVDVVATRALLFVAMTAVVVAVYAVGVGVLGHRVLSDSAVGVLMGAVLAAVLLPAYAYARRGVDWLLYGDRADPYQAVVRAGRAVEALAGGAGLLDVLIESVREALRLSYVAVCSEEKSTVAESGTAPGRTYELPLRLGGVDVGWLVVARGREVLTRGDRRLLAGVTPLFASALDTLRHGAELQSVREQLVVAHQEERRRLRRELHDGLGPSLAAVSLGIDAARSRIRRDPQAGDVLLASVQDDLRDSVVEMRRLIDALRPAALDQLGLVPALRQQLAGLTANGRPHLAVLAPDDLTDLSAAVEVAAYRIAVEAVTNTVRHAAAGACTVELTVAGGELVVVVADDGRGRSGRPPGTGTRSMVERAEEIGGSLDVTDGSPTGTVVRALLPLGAGRPIVGLPADDPPVEDRA